MAKKNPEPGPRVVVRGGWTFHVGTDSVEGKKQFEAGGVIREVTGKTLDEAKHLAADIDRFVAQRARGLAEQAKQEADRLRAHADKVEAGTL